MLAVDHLYEEPTILAAATGHHRIFAQIAYKRVRELQYAPMVMAEAAHLARTFPICWWMNGRNPVLIALRSMLSGGRGHSADAPILEPHLPLVLQCFPVMVPDSAAMERQQLQFDRTIADNPTDIGAPLLLPDGKMSRAALDRARKAVAFARALPDTEAVSRDLLASGLLEPWPLHFDLGEGETVAIDDLMVLSAARLHDMELSSLIARHGVGVGMFLSLHRASLFRASNLLAAAKQAVMQAPSQAVAENMAG